MLPIIIIILLILLGIIFLTGLVFFIRSLILKKNMGCGIVGLLTMIIILLIYFLGPDIMNYQSKEDFIEGFESVTQLSYPHSGKIIERKHEEGLGFFPDSKTVAIIEMDTLDYTKLLHDVQLSKNFELDTLSISENFSPTYFLKEVIPADEFNYVFRFQISAKYVCFLWFHKNRQTIVYKKY